MPILSSLKTYSAMGKEQQVAGLTHIDKQRFAFSAYRFHDDDPVFFQKGLRLTCRCGELLNGKPIGDPQPTEYRTYTWVYQW